MKPWASNREKFARRYVGKGAAEYEETRAGPKWQAEEDVFDEFYSRVQPRKVLDCPVGTGRFIDRYLRGGASALGVDLSDDMLAQAAQKIPPGADVRLRKADVLDPAQASALERDHDLIVCVRFVYAVEKHRLPGLFERFNATGAKHLLVGARAWADSTDWGTYLAWYLWNTEKKRPRLRRRFNRYIPSEKNLHRIMKEAGWEIMDRKSIQDDGHSIGRYFYLLRNLRA